MSPKGSLIELHENSVTKHFTDPRAFARELKIYQRGLVMTPRLLDFREPDWISLERVSGEPYLDCELDEAAVSLIAASIAEFHLSSLQGPLCLCHWDNQPRNILLDDHYCHLIDFSEAREAPPEEDVTHLLLFWASEYPLSCLRALIQAFIQAYDRFLPLNPDRWKSSLEKSILRFDERRSQYCHRDPRLDRSELLRNRELLRGLL